MGLDLVPLSFGRSHQQFLGNLVRSSGLLTAIAGFYLAELPGLIVGLSLSAVFGQLYLVATFPEQRGGVHLQTLRFTAGLGAVVGLSLWGPVAWAQQHSLGMRIVVAAALIVGTVAVTGLVVRRAIRRRRTQ